MMPTREQWIAYYLHGVPIPGQVAPPPQANAPQTLTPGQAEQEGAMLAFGISQIRQHH